MMTITYLHNKRQKSGALERLQKSIVASLHPAAALWQIFRGFCCSVCAETGAKFAKNSYVRFLSKLPHHHTDDTQRPNEQILKPISTLPHKHYTQHNRCVYVAKNKLLSEIITANIQRRTHVITRIALFSNIFRQLRHTHKITLIVFANLPK